MNLGKEKLSRSRVPGNVGSNAALQAVNPAPSFLASRQTTITNVNVLQNCQRREE